MTKYEEIKRTSLDPAGYQIGLDARALGTNTIIHATTYLVRKNQKGKAPRRLLTLEDLVSIVVLTFETREPRDAIFAVLALAKDNKFTQGDMHAITEDPRISPDYGKSLLDVYSGFIHYCVEKSESLDILCRNWALPEQLGMGDAPKQDGRGRTDKEMPTWIPFISRSAFGEPRGISSGRVNGDSFVSSPGRNGQQTYNASNGLRAFAKFGTSESEPEVGVGVQPSSTSRITFATSASGGKSSKWENVRQKQRDFPVSDYEEFLDKMWKPSLVSAQNYNGILTVRGFCLDIVKEVSSRVMGKGIVPNEALMMGGWQHRGPQNQDVPDQLWRTLVADQGPDGTSTPGWYRRACLKCLQHTGRVGDLDIEALKKMTRQGSKMPSTMILFLERAQAVVWGRRFFNTSGSRSEGEEPFFGLGPRNVKVGDMVCIIFGCSVPVILSKIHTESDHESTYYEFVGECYVHGVMDGEAVEEMLAIYQYEGKKSWRTTFNLK
jgi:hypothetical protein